MVVKYGAGTCIQKQHIFTINRMPRTSVQLATACAANNLSMSSCELLRVPNMELYFTSYFYNFYLVSFPTNGHVYVCAKVYWLTTREEEFRIHSDVLSVYQKPITK